MPTKPVASSNPAAYFKQYRQLLGFASQQEAKAFLAGKDIFPSVDYAYIEALIERIEAVLIRLNNQIHQDCRRSDMMAFCRRYLFHSYTIIKDANLLPRLNNQGRRPEEVLFSWLRGFVVCEYFTPSFSQVFGVPLNSITQIGDDDLGSIESFKRSPKADLQIVVNKMPVRIEVQSGFQGINDIKEHKVREARRVFNEEKMPTICIHIDVYNGQVAFVRLDHIAEDDVHFVTRQQMEGQSVFSIDQNYFKWRLLEPLPRFQELELAL